MLRQAGSIEHDSNELLDLQDQEQQAIEYLKNFNNPKSEAFEPTIFSSVDLPDIKNAFFRKNVVEPYARWARTVVRNEADVVMITHLLLYTSTTLPSAIYLFYNFRWWHAILHGVMQGWYAGAYTLLKHQHIHARGVLSKKYAFVDELFPYILDPLMGHTWNSYYFHHVKHHHVEGNGPNDLSSTVRYQRDDVWDFMRYVGRFYFLIWFDLPRYFLRNRKPTMAFQAAACELGNYAFLYFLFMFVNTRATIFVFLTPLALMRLALMTGNWGQHALVDELEPDSDFRSSITLIDVPVSSIDIICFQHRLKFHRATAIATTMATTLLTISTPSATGVSIPWHSCRKRSSTPMSTPLSSTISTT